jgi:hypothetical protein
VNALRVFVFSLVWMLASSVVAQESIKYQGNFFRVPGSVRVALVEKAGKLTGSYSFQGKQTLFRLVGTVAANGTIRLDEFLKSKRTGSFVGHGVRLEGVLYTISGTRSKPNGSQRTDFSFERVDERFSKAFWSFMRDSRKGKYFDIDVSYPQIVGVKGKFWAKTNAALKAFAGADGFVKMANEEKPDAPYGYYVSNHISVGTDGLISILFDFVQEGVGAHGTLGSLWLMLDPRSGTPVSLRQFFKPGTNFADRLFKSILQNWGTNDNKPTDLTEFARDNASLMDYGSVGVDRLGFHFEFGSPCGVCAPFSIRVPFQGLEDIFDFNGPIKFLQPKGFIAKPKPIQPPTPQPSTVETPPAPSQPIAPASNSAPSSSIDLSKVSGQWSGMNDLSQNESVVLADVRLDLNLEVTPGQRAGTIEYIIAEGLLCRAELTLEGTVSAGDSTGYIFSQQGAEENDLECALNAPVNAWPDLVSGGLEVTFQMPFGSSRQSVTILLAR